MKTIIKSILFTAVLALVITGCQKDVDDQNVTLKSVSNPKYVNPWHPAGGAAQECINAGSSCGLSYKIDGWDVGNKDGAYNDGIFTITNSTSKSFTYSSTYPICMIIIKAGTGAYIYTVDGDDAYNGTITLPKGARAISHVTFCYSEPVKLVIAVKARYMAGTEGGYYIDPGTYNAAASVGKYILTGGSCKWIGINEYPTINSFTLMDFFYRNETVGSISVTKGINTVTITVTMKGNGELVETRFFVGSSEQDLLNSIPVGDDCPDYTTPLWHIDYTRGNSVSWTVPY